MSNNLKKAVGYWTVEIWNNEMFKYGHDGDTHSYSTFKDAQNCWNCMKKFKHKDVVKCTGSEGQFLCYGIVQGNDYPEPYYCVAILRNYPEIDEEPSGGICLRETEMELVPNEVVP